MFEILFYGGLVLAVTFFALTIVLFFRNDMRMVFRYYLESSGKIEFKRVKGRGKPKENKSKIGTTKQELKVVASAQEMTAVIEEDANETELLDIAESYATALLEAEDATMLLDMDDEEDN